MVVIVQLLDIPPTAIKILKTIAKLRKEAASKLPEVLSIPQSTLMSYLEFLKQKNLIKVERRVRKFYRTTDEGKEYLESLPEEKVIKYLMSRGGEAPIKEIVKDLGERIVNIGLSWCRKRKWIVISKGVAKLIKYEELKRHRELLSTCLNECEAKKEDTKIINELLERGLLKEFETTEYWIEITPRGISLASELPEELKVISKLSVDTIATGLWKSIILKPYNVEAEPPRIYPGRKHPLAEFIEMVRDVMYSLGFEEIEDDYVIPELWNFDALFQAQDHPARDIHDTLAVKSKEAYLKAYGDVVERIRVAHESGGIKDSKGWRYKWSYEKASKLILRSQTTAATIRYLTKHREPPVRVFIIDKVFRRDPLDATHLPDFYQMDGIIMERDFNFRKLLGVLEQIGKGIGIEKLKFKPGYFPFTEPSVEGYAYIKGVGWIEVFGAGMFRPEVLYIAGVKHPVGAWGMGIERLAMAVLGLNDIRLLYPYDISILRKMIIPRW